MSQALLRDPSTGEIASETVSLDTTGKSKMLGFPPYLPPSDLIVEVISRSAKSAIPLREEWTSPSLGFGVAVIRTVTDCEAYEEIASERLEDM